MSRQRAAPPRSTPGPTQSPARGTVPAVARAARLLDVLAAAPSPLSLNALTEALALPKSTVHGLCATLVQAELLNRYDNGSYHLGMRVMDLAHAYLSRTDLSMEFARLVEQNQPMPEESLVLSVLDGADIVYVGCRNGNRPFGFHFRFGMRLPANCAASGKAMLAHLSAASIRNLAGQGALLGLTERSVTDPAKLLAELRIVRTRGYAIDDEETRAGMVCFGAPVFKASSTEAVAAIGISLPKEALDGRRRDEAIDTVTSLAQTLSRRLGAG